VLAGSRSRALAACVAVVCHVVLAPGRAHAQTTDVTTEGMVIDVEKDDLVVDVGLRAGAAEGAVVEIWRPLRLKHPVTGKIIVDRFLIGRLRLTQVRPNLSLAKPEGTLSRPAEKGDVVVLARAATPTPTPTPTSTTPPSTDDETRALSQLFDTLRGTDVVTRIRAYETYIGQRPQGPYARVLWEESQELHKLLTPSEASVPAARKSTDVSAWAEPIEHVVAGEPLRIAIGLVGDASGAVLHTRKVGNPTYSSEPMTKVGTEYWAATRDASTRSPSSAPRSRTSPTSPWSLAIT